MDHFMVQHFGGIRMLVTYDRDLNPWDFYWSHYRLMKELPRAATV